MSVRKLLRTDTFFDCCRTESMAAPILPKENKYHRILNKMIVLQTFSSSFLIVKYEYQQTHLQMRENNSRKRNRTYKQLWQQEENTI